MILWMKVSGNGAIHGLSCCFILFIVLTHRAVDFWSQCIGDTEVDGNGFGEQGTTALMDAETADALGSGGGREIKQLVQDEV